MSLAERLRGSVRAKLLALVLAPLMLGFPLIMGLLWYWGEVYYHRLMVSRVASDLATAHGYFERVIDGVGSRVQALAGSHALAQSLAHETPEAVAALLGARKGGLALDFLNLLDVNGRVLHSSTAMAAGSARGDWSVVQRAIGARGGSVVERFAAAELAAIDVGLRERARLALVATPRARPDPRPEEERGLVVHAAAPVLDAAGNLVAVLEGGVLLNGNLDFVDTLNAIVYREGSLPEGSEGTATLFVDDVRIATNVRLFEGARALGTRASDEVRAHVLDHGRTWLETAFVVNDWYVSAYEPVMDSRGERVGMLYVGFLEAPFRAAKRTALLVVGALALLVSAAGALLTLFWARGIFRPIERMHATIGRIDAGDEHARVGDVASRDELGRLATAFDHLLEEQAARRAELQALNASLEAAADEHGLRAQRLPAVTAPCGDRADRAQARQVGHGHSRCHAQEAFGALVGVQHLAMNRRRPVLTGEEMRKEFGPVQRAHGYRGDAGACSAGQRQVSDVAEHQVRLQPAEQAGVALDQLIPSRMLTAVGLRRCVEVEADGIVHHIAEVAALLQVAEAGRYAGLQLVGWQAAADRQAQIRQATGQRVEHRRRLCQMAEAVCRDIDEEVCWRVHRRGAGQTKRASIAPGRSAGSGIHTL